MLSLPENSKKSSRALFWAGLLILAVIYIIFSMRFLASRMDASFTQALSVLQARSDALIGSVEGISRVVKPGQGNEFAIALAEIARQPGVAWLAVVDEDGKIVADGIRELAGKRMYTRAELASLAPRQFVQGRFSPDEPEVFETWKIFNSAHGKKRDPWVAFAALDAKSILQELDESAAARAWEALITGIALFSFIIMLYYGYSYRKSRKAYEDASILAKQVIMNYPAPLLAVNLAGAVALANKSAAAMLDLPESGANLNERPWLDWHSLEEEARSSGAVWERDLELAMPDGERRPISATCSPIYDAGRNLTAYLFVLRDMTEIRELRHKLERARHLSAVGRLAAGFAHEIRNPLGSICGYAHYLSEKLASDPASASIAALLEEEGRRLNGAVADLLGATRKPELQPGRVLLADIAAKAMRLVNEDARLKNISLELRDGLPVNAPPLVADGNRLLQAALNLMLNAVQASPEGGKVVISLDYQPVKKLWSLVVEDSGPGLSEDELGRIFLPYYTTKAGGAGLGLAISRQIAESHGGWISTASTSQGAAFTLEFASLDQEDEK